MPVFRKLVGILLGLLVLALSMSAGAFIARSFGFYLYLQESWDRSDAVITAGLVGFASTVLIFLTIRLLVRSEGG